MRQLRVLAVLIVALLHGGALRAQHEHHEHAMPAAPADARIGKVDFQTSCDPEVRETFNEAVALLHSFWFAESRHAFEAVLQADPDCAMAYWGIALTHWSNPFAGVRSAEVIARGSATVARARAAGGPTPREQGYIEAVGMLFSGDDPATQRQRVLDYEAAMTRVADANPSDVEAQIFQALAIAQAALPTDKTYARQLQAGALLEPLFARMPDHPGLAHYIIHAYDAPPLAPKALPAARAYAAIAPDVPHALHMPSHTFTRVGLWPDSVASNIRSADVAEQHGATGEVLHALDYLTYAYLQMGMDAQALQVVERAQQLLRAGGSEAGAATPMGLANPFAAAAIPARHALERRQWAEAAQLPVVPTPATPYIQAMTHFARALGLARTGKVAEAQTEVAQLRALQAREAELKDDYWAGIIDIQRRAAEAWVLFAQGRQDEGIALMRAAAEAEDATDKAAVTPGPLAPAREILGDMLLEAGRPEQALAAFEALTAREPNRFLALYGAGQAAAQMGQAGRAKAYYATLAQVCEGAGPERPELRQARALAAR